MEKYIRFLLEGGADAAVKIDATTVETAAWTVYRCRYGCDFYGRTHCCPPNAPTWKETREMLDCFSYGILFHSHEIKNVTSLAVAAARELFLDGYYKAIAFGCGPCRKCEKCDPVRCRFPKLTVPSMEGCGIDVFATARNNGFTMRPLREKGETPDYFGLVMVE